MCGNDQDHVSPVDFLLDGSGKFSGLFDREKDACKRSSASGDSVSTTRNTSCIVILSSLHGLGDKEIYVGKWCIEKSLLTRENLTNFADITSESIY